MKIRIITINIPESYIRAIKVLTTGPDALYPSRSELIRVAVREFLIKELEAAKSFVKFQEQSPFTEKYPSKTEENGEIGFEVDIDEILGLIPEEIPENVGKDERMAVDIEYKTLFQQDFQRVPTMKTPLENSGSARDLGASRVMIDGKVFNLK